MTERPNILLIMTDQQRGDCLGLENHPVLLTPNMDNIGARGVRFSRFYSECPSCIAARRCLLAGQTPQRHGMVGYAEGQAWEPDATLPGVLRDAGYQTVLFGRSMHQYPTRKRFGYEWMETADHRNPTAGYGKWLRDNAPTDCGGWFGGGVMHNDFTAHPWPLSEHLHMTNWTVSRALEFLTMRDPTTPFFMTVSFIAPHPPLQPPAFYFERYLRTGVPDPVIGDWACDPDTLEQHGGSDNVAPVRLKLEGEQLRSTRAAYYGLINHVDDQLRRLLNPVVGLPSMSGGRNTIVVFTSDHGEMLGDHHLWRKGFAYEPAARVPCLIHAPMCNELKPGTVIDRPAGLADVMPTLLDMVGLNIPASVNGRSLWPLMRGETPAWREAIHIEHAGYHQALTDGHVKYVWQPQNGVEQLFDLDQDPLECRDLAGVPEHAPALQAWRERLIARLAKRPEGFVHDGALVAGRPYTAMIPDSATTSA